MADELHLRKLQSLSDLGLAILICLVAHEHCLIETTLLSLDDVTCELELILTENFRLRHITVECSKSTTPDEFAHLILSMETNSTRSDVSTRNRHDKYFNPATFQSGSRSSATKVQVTSASIFNVIIAKNLNQTSKQVQDQALELVRTRRLLSRTSTYNAPKHFLFITLLVTGEGPRLIKHLNDSIFISHFYHPHNSLEYNEKDLNKDSSSSSSSVVKFSSSHQDSSKISSPIVSFQDIEKLSELCESVMLSMEVKQYQMDIISFLRIHRAVAGGVTALATKMFEKLARCLATLHNLSFVTPSLITLAARKIYLHRIQIVKPKYERSMQWGSDIGAVAALLNGVTVEDILDEVLGESGAEAPF
ncbi:hypothetical protein OnM2_088007 [Erysiphe neolycopersici]|uniref:magnesium chelatase n=1 Tax=Erysiphe neolycopersici TaxID=212602 RepID=A0A420HDV2_9PEZI|nr:hypothetical protein OnM2_088007 [Erysiphe neolycopersici]